MLSCQHFGARLSGTPVTGEACFNVWKNYTFQGDPVCELAVRDAISQAPGANALADVTLEGRGTCVHVKGLAVTQ